MNLQTKTLHRFALLFLVFFIATATFAQDTRIRFRLPERIRVSERTNLSRRDNGRYQGLLTREATGYLTQISEAIEGLEGATGYEGEFFLYEQLRRDMQQVARPVDRSIEARVVLAERGLFLYSPPFPSYHAIPVLPEGPLRVGQSWNLWGQIRLQPDKSAPALNLPVYILYTYEGIETWNGAPAHRIEAQFATRYPLPERDGDEDGPVVDYEGEIAAVQGSHELTIMIPTSGSQHMFIRDEISEQYRFRDGSSSTYTGHTLLFLGGLSIEQRNQIAESVEEDLDEQDVSIEQTDTGVRLTIQALRFLPDQAILVPEERPRLDQVAKALEQVDNARFLIVGHTADVGSVESQQRLSEERAETIAQALVERGIDPNRLDLQGRGGTQPVATNATEQGRRRNRRVEIYILEQ
jgi:outer membrane protein OmpA-like peptidoglycan-associated protein